MPPVGDTTPVVKKLDEVIDELRKMNTHLQNLEGMMASQI